MKKDLEVRQDKMTVEWSGKAAGLFASVDVHLCFSDFQHLQCSSSQLNTPPPITISNKLPELNAFHDSLTKKLDSINSRLSSDNGIDSGPGPGT